MANGNREVNSVVRWKEANAAGMRRQPEKRVSMAELLCEKALASLKGGNAYMAQEILELMGREARVRRALEVGMHIPLVNTIASLPLLAGSFDTGEMDRKGEGAVSGLKVELLASRLVFHRDEDVRDAARNYRFDGVGMTEERLRSILERAAEGASNEEFARAGFIALVELIRREDFEQADRVIKDCRLGPRQAGDAAIIAYLGRIHPNLVGRGMDGFVPPPVLPEPEALDNLRLAHPGCLERFGVRWLVDWSRAGFLGRAAPVSDGLMGI